MQLYTRFPIEFLNSTHSNPLEYNHRPRVLECIHPTAAMDDVTQAGHKLGDNTCVANSGWLIINVCNEPLFSTVYSIDNTIHFGMSRSNKI